MQRQRRGVRRIQHRLLIGIQLHERDVRRRHGGRLRRRPCGAWSLTAYGWNSRAIEFTASNIAAWTIARLRDLQRGIEWRRGGRLERDDVPVQHDIGASEHGLEAAAIRRGPQS